MSPTIYDSHRLYRTVRHVFGKKLQVVEGKTTFLSDVADEREEKGRDARFDTIFGRELDQPERRLC